MILLDWLVIAAYFAAIVSFAVARSRYQTNVKDYYLASRKVKWWQSGASTMATQLGAISFVSAPAFVAVKEGGGLKWLCYEFGVPLGLLLVIMVIIPILHRGEHISIYEYLEKRFDRGTRTLVSILFQLGRGLATAVSILAGGLIISTALPVSTAQAIILIGAVTILYDALGGIRVVILSDFFQMLIIILGLVICGGAAMWLVGWESAWQALEPSRLRILDFRHLGLTSEGAYAFWPMTIGGMFLYASYYGCDQSQVQRELSVGDLHGVRKSLLVNAFGRFPIVLLYCVMGVLVGAVFTFPEHIAAIASEMQIGPAAVNEILHSDPDRMVPMFILTFLPAGAVGLIFVAILSALMSSLDSAINSLSAVTMQDFYRPYIRSSASDRHYLVVSKILTVLWGGFCVIAALAFAQAGEATRETTIVLINAVGSLLYGPILAAFLMGMLSRRVLSTDIKAGVLFGIGVNIVLWQTSSISWLWWNLTGFACAVSASVLCSYIWEPARIKLVRSGLVHSERKEYGRWEITVYAVIAYFAAIIVISYAIQSIA